MESPHRTYQLFARSLSKEITTEEQAELFQLLNDNIMLQQQYEILRQLWGQEKTANEEIETEEDRLHISRILQLAKKKQDDEQLSISTRPATNTRLSKRRRRKTWRVVAVCCALLVGLGYVVWNNNIATYTAKKAPAINYETITARNGSRMRSVLPDGSTVWVNAGSSISYEGDFKGATREVTLNGEAYFDVVKNPAKPFIVHTGGISIKVLGTAFNVKSYASDTIVETTLIHGLVQVTKEHDPQHKAIYLHPNEKLTLQKTVENNKDTITNSPVVLHEQFPVYAIETLDTSIAPNEVIETAWLYNRLAFRGEKFETLAQKLERWYNIHIVFEDEQVKHLSFNGSFENETVEQAFEALKAAVPFNYKIHTHDISVTSSK